MFTSVDALIEAIETWSVHWNDDPKPFVWHKPAEEIIRQGASRMEALDRTKSATRH